MAVFMILRGGSIGDMDVRSKTIAGLFLLTVNVFSAQLWSESCKRCSAIEYEQNMYLREDEENNVYEYLPDILRGDPRTTNMAEAQEEDGGSGSCVGGSYGTFGETT